MVQQGLNGNPLGVMRAFSPGLGNITSAVTGESTGARGRITNKYDTPYDRLLRLMGFRSTSEANTQYISDIIWNSRNQKSDERKQAIDNYINNPSSENAAVLKALNIKPSTVAKERDRKKMSRMERLDDSPSRDKEADSLLEFNR